MINIHLNYLPHEQTVQTQVQTGNEGNTYNNAGLLPVVPVPVGHPRNPLVLGGKIDAGRKE